MDDALVASMSEFCPSGGSDLLFGVQKAELGPESGMHRLGGNSVVIAERADERWKGTPAR